MILYDTIGMIEHSERNFPYVHAHVDMPFYSLLTADFVNNISAFPNTVEKKGSELYYADNTKVGDWYEETQLREGEMLRLTSLKALDQHFLVIDEQHITFVAPADYATIVPGTTMLGVGSDGNFEIISSNTDYAIYLLVTQLTTLTENAVRARIIVQDL